MKKSVKRLIGVLLSIMLMFTMGTTAFAAEGGSSAVEDGTYMLNGISSSLGMFHIEKAKVTVSGEDATLDIISSNADRYDEIYLGEYSDITEENVDTIGTKGTVIDADNNLIEFELGLKTADISKELKYVLRYRKDYKDKNGEWYKSKNADYYYLTLGELTPLPSVADATIADIPAQTYTGKAIEPELSLKIGETELVKDQDYEVSFSDNIKAGTASAVITGIGDYVGTTSTEFIINKADQTLKMSTSAKTVKYAKVKKKAQYTTKVKVTGAKTKLTYSKVSGSKKLTIGKTTGKIKVAKKTKKSTYTIKVKATAASGSNYNKATVTKTIKVKVK